MSYNDNNDDSYGSSNRQGQSGGYGDDRVDRDTGLGGRTGGIGNDSDSYGSGGARSGGIGGNDSYGSSGNDAYGSSDNDNRGFADKARDKLSSNRSDRPDDPISGTNYDQSSSGRNTGYGNDSSDSYGSNDNRGFADKAKDKLSSDRSDRPDDPISGTNYDQSSTGRSGGLGDDSYGSSNRSGAGEYGTSGSGYGDNTSSSGYGDNTSSNYGGTGQDNRSLTEKAKDKLSSNRNDRPDDPISGKNYGEDNDRSYGSSDNSNNKPSLMDKVKDKVGLNKDKSDNSYGSDSYGSSGGNDGSYGSGNYGSSGRSDNY